jgi:hypothetical protein
MMMPLLLLLLYYRYNILYTLQAKYSFITLKRAVSSH